jgi:TRAP-type mannitol/chloroaromatic compound transport system permease small subunit
VKKIIHIIDNLNEWIGKIVSCSIVVLTLLVVIEVIMRYVFRKPTIWSFEVTTQLFGFYFMTLAGYSLLHGAHVAVDVVSETLTQKKQAFLQILSYVLFFFPFCLVLLYQGTVYATKSWEIKETSWSVFAPPLYPIKTVIPISAFLLLLQGVVVFYKEIQKYKGEKKNV